MSAILENAGHVENISRIGNNCCTRQIARLCQPFHVIISFVVFVYICVCAQIIISLFSPYQQIYWSQYFILQILVSMPSIIKLNIKHNFFPILCGSVTLVKRNNPGLVSGNVKLR